jgi:hypothetical protein
MTTRHRHKNILVTPQTEPIWEQIAEDMAPKVPEGIFHSEYANGHAVDFKAKLQIRTQQIAIGIPMDELMFSKFLANFIGMNIMPWDSLITTQSTYLPEARNQIHDIFLEKAEGTHLLMLDSDVLPPPNYISRMLMHNKPMVSGYYRKKEKYPVKDKDGNITTIQRPVVYDYYGVSKDKNHDEFIGRLNPGTGLERVDAAGAGCWLMRRDVAVAIGKSPYDMNRSGEDMTLCRKVTAAGFEMFVDWDAACAHAGVFFV